MKYRFITIMHNMKLETIKNRGITIFPGARISNGSNILNQTLKTEIMRYTAGRHSLDEFENAVYFYIDSELKDIASISEMDEIGVNSTFFYLREVQHFINQLWEVKDNNVYVRDGFLIAYNKTFEDGVTYKASLSAIFSSSTLEREETLFSEKELKLAIDKYQFEVLGINIDYKYPTDDHFFKYSKSERLDRAFYFILNARASTVIPMKIVSYCTALECLFTDSNTEVNHKIAERVAHFLGKTSNEKKELYILIKKAYDVRSKIVHGSYLKGKSDDLKYVSRDLDAVLRRLLSAESNIFNKKDKELEDYFIDLLFSSRKQL